jgi:hypothetical protein
MQAAMQASHRSVLPSCRGLTRFLQIGGGFITLHYPNSICVENIEGVSCTYSRDRLTGGAADFLFGLNIRTSSAWSIRAIEFGGYAGPNVELSTIGAGVIYTFQPRAHHNP